MLKLTPLIYSKPIGACTYRFSISIVSCVSLCLMAAGDAFAANEFSLKFDTSLTTNNNTFRYYVRPDNSITANIVEGVDPRLTELEKTVQLIAGITLPILSDDTKLTLSGSLGQHKYKEYKQLDERYSAVDAAIDSQVTRTLKVRGFYSRNEDLFQYIDGSFTQLDVSKQSRSGIGFVLNVYNDFYLQSAFNREQVNYRQDINQRYNSQSKSFTTGLQYRSTLGTLLSTGAKVTSTDFPNRTSEQIRDLDNHYRENEVFVDAEWPYSVKTIFSGHVGILDRKYELLSEKSNKLLNLLVRGTYLYSPKLRVDLQLFDRPFNIVDPNILYLTSRGLRTDVIWNVSDKTRVNASLLLQKSDQTLIPRIVSITDGNSRSENLSRVGLGAHYLIDRSIKLYFDAYYEKNKRQFDGSNLSQTIMRMGIEYTYENMAGTAKRLALNRYQQSLSTTSDLK